MLRFFSTHKLILTISILLACVPFFWFKPGEMDLGGDGSRLYFYDPVNQLRHLAFYYVSPFGIGVAEAKFAYLPFIGILAILKQIISSSYVLISVHNSIKIVIGFLAVYAIVKELIGKTNKDVVLGVELASILAGLFYIFTPAMVGNYTRALLTHNQVFLNPLMFYLLLRFFLTGNMKYMWIALPISVIFAVNFSYSAGPAFFAFYPLAFLFIFFYSRFIKHVKIPWKKLFLIILLFLGPHAFHLIPQISDLFTTGSDINTRAFDTEGIKEQIGYFYAVLPIPKISFYLLSYSLEKQLIGAFVLIPLIIIVGLLFNRKRERTILLAAGFFLLTLFFATAKVTNITVKIYEWFFYIPGFTMFRNFYGQWQFAFSFFYSLLFGLAIFSILERIRIKIVSKTIFLALFVFFVISSWKFIDGTLTNPFYEGAKNKKIAIVMDPKYEETLAFIRSLQADGKILVLPFTDFYIQVIHGLNDGAYIGRSTIGQLTGKKDFAGYMDISPYSEIFWQLSKEGDFESIKKLLGLLNIRYIFHNSDTRIYDETFPGRPYSPNYVRKYMPSNQEEYKKFVKNLSNEKIFQRSYYSIYEIGEKSFLPHFYTASKTFPYKDDPEVISYGKASLFFQKSADTKRPVYIESKTCETIFSKKTCVGEGVSMEKNLPKIHFEKINPTKYKVKVFEAKDPYILVFSESFHKNWKLFVSTKSLHREENVLESYFEGQVQEGRHKNIFIDSDTFETLGLKALSENKHFVVNGYANGWYISPQDTEEKKEYEFIVEMTGQRIFYVSLALSGITLCVFLIWGGKFLLSNRKKKTSINKTKN